MAKWGVVERSRRPIVKSKPPALDGTRNEKSNSADIRRGTQPKTQRGSCLRNRPESTATTSFVHSYATRPAMAKRGVSRFGGDLVQRCETHRRQADSHFGSATGFRESASVGKACRSRSPPTMSRKPSFPRHPPTGSTDTDTRQSQVESSPPVIELNVGKPERGGESLPLRPSL